MTRLFVIILFVVVIISVVLVGDIFGQIYLSFPKSDALAETFVIESGEGVNQISQHLKDQEFIKSMFVFESYIWWRGLGSKFMAGNFELKKGMSVNKIVRLLTTQPAQNEKEITVIEGWSLRDFGYYLENQGMFQAEELHELAGFPATDYRGLRALTRPKDFSDEYNFLDDKPAYVGLEGYLFPDTYRIFADATVEDIVRKMLNNFDKKLTPELRVEISRQGKSIFDIIIMASILEQEVQSEKDKKLVADLFWRRLDAGMALQADSTVNYVTGGDRAQATYKDLEVDSYFNTYKHRGLPLGPICSPGLTSIKAAIYPTSNNSWYFLTTPEGQVIYSGDFEEHKDNRAIYLQ
ncbi:MAG: endolytic transglycosylase MltG [Patescibacteria group bacterium]|nr:endolytic transglycosylase MltG [Patescibacteria group bacterium]